MDRWRVITQRCRTLPADDVPVVLAIQGPHGPVIHAAGPVAQSRGIQTANRIVDVQAIHPDLHVEPADPQGDAALLDRLVHWARRWCPWTTRDGADGLLLDITGAAHLFGGEAALLRDICRRFAMQGLTARVATAPNAGAAQALARYAANGTICTETDVGAHLAPLPVTALRLTEDVVRLLTTLGLKTIGAVRAMPRVTLMRRFGHLAADVNPVVLLDRAHGALPEPLNAPPETLHFLVRARLAEPVLDLAPHLPDLAQNLATDLARAGQGARALRLTVYRVDGQWRFADVATGRATRDAEHMQRLLQGKLDRIDPGFGFDMITLEALRTEPMALVQRNLDSTQDPERDVATLVDRLTARLGAERVTWTRSNESHIPERVEHRIPALAAPPSDPLALMHERPLRLLDHPEEIRVLYAVPEGPPARFRWRRVDHQATRHQGPERIAPEWWRDRPGTRLRDYYKVEVQDGRRFWLFREGLLGDGRGDAPRWFLHGFFA